MCALIEVDFASERVCMCNLDLYVAISMYHHEALFSRMTEWNRLQGHVVINHPRPCRLGMPCVVFDETATTTDVCLSVSSSSTSSSAPSKAWLTRATVHRLRRRNSTPKATDLSSKGIVLHCGWKTTCKAVFIGILVCGNWGKTKY